MSTFLTTIAETLWWKASAGLRKKGEYYDKAVRVIGWVFCFRFFEHLAVGFMLRFADDVFAAWNQTFYFGHCLAVLLIVVSLAMMFLLPRPREPEEKKDQ